MDDLPWRDWLDRDRTKQLIRYLRIHEGMGEKKARAEARRIVALVREAERFDEDSKKVLRETARMVESQEEQDRRQKLAQSAQRLERTYAARRARGQVPNGLRRWVSDVRRLVKDPVRPPSVKRLAKAETAVERLCAALEGET